MGKFCKKCGKEKIECSCEKSDISVYTPAVMTLLFIVFGIIGVIALFFMAM